MVLVDIVDSTKFTERVGDQRAAEVMRIYDRIFRGLLIKYDGLEIDKTDGALLLFETMKDALNYVMEYHHLVEKHLGLKSRVGVHCGHVMTHSNSAAFIARGAKPIEVDGLQKSIAARIMSLASGGQTFLSKRAGEYAASVRGNLLMRDLGEWKLKGVQEAMRLYAIGKTLESLKRPKQTDKVRLIKPPKMSSKELWRMRAKRYVLLPTFICGLYWLLALLAFMEYSGQINSGVFLPIYRAVVAAAEVIIAITAMR